MKAQLRSSKDIMYLLLVIGFAILQVDYALLIALGIAFLDSCLSLESEPSWSLGNYQDLSSDYKMAIRLLIIYEASDGAARQLIGRKIVKFRVNASSPTLFLLYARYKVGSVMQE